MGSTMRCTWLAAALLASVVGCSTPDASNPGRGNALPNGAPCTTATDCASQLCLNGACHGAGGGTGRLNGSPCGSAVDCASGHCGANSICQAVAGGTGLANGARCAGAGECASGVCNNGACQGTGRGNGAPNGARCAGASDCASGNCAADVCTAPGGGAPDGGQPAMDASVTDGGTVTDAGRADATNASAPPMIGVVSALGEICDNGLDDNQDGLADEDCSCTPGARQSCYPGAQAQAGGTRCQWGSMTCLPSGRWGECEGFGRPQTETCNGQDDNCDGRIDENCECPTEGATRSCYGAQEATLGVSVCRAGTQRCERDMAGQLYWGECDGMVVPNFERCNGVDDDCDGTTDEGCECEVGATRGCYNGATGTAGQGVCRAGSQRCLPRMAGGSGWSACEAAVEPTTETCNGADDDCDGQLDEDCACTPGETRSCLAGLTADLVSVGACAAGRVTCLPSGRWGACEGAVAPTTERCNGRDDDCDGETDEGCLCPTGQTAVYRQRAPMMSAPQCGLQPGDGGANVVMQCEAARCPEGQVSLEVRPGRFECVQPPPRCDLPRYLAWYPASGWVCDRGCEVVVRYGGVFGTDAVCAPRPQDTMCRNACFRVFDPALRAWVCGERCAGGMQGIRVLGMQICLPCPDPPGERIRTGD